MKVSKNQKDFELVVAPNDGFICGFEFLIKAIKIEDNVLITGPCARAREIRVFNRENS